MSKISKMSSQIMKVSRLSTTVGVSHVKSPAPASFQVLQAPDQIVFSKKQSETSQADQESASEGLGLGLPLTMLPSKRWETKDETKHRVSISIVNKL